MTATVTNERSVREAEQAVVKQRNEAAFVRMLTERYGGTPKRSRGLCCITRLIPGKRCTLGEGLGHRCAPPCTDHPTLWTVNGNAVAYASHPYQGQLGVELDAARAFAEEHNLDIVTSDASWWNPPPFTGYAATSLVVYLVRPAGAS